MSGIVADIDSRRDRRSRMTVTMMTVAVVASWLLAAGEVAAQEVPFDAVVVDEKVEVRAGPGTAFYVVGELNRGTMVTVKAVMYGYYQIASPPQVYSYISKAYVEAKGDGRVGVVTSDNAVVKAAKADGPAHMSYQAQLKPEPGQTVQIVGAAGDFYKIVPPAGADVFLPPGSVRRATVAELAVSEPAEEAPVAEAPVAADEVTVQPTAVEAIPPIAVAPVEPPQPLVIESVQTAAAVEPATEPVEPVAPEATGQLRVTEADVKLVQPAAAAEPEAPEAVAAEPEAAAEPSGAPGATRWPKALSPKVAAAEEALRAAWDLPLEEQPIDELLSQYQQLATDQRLPLSDRRLVLMRLNDLRRNRQLVDVLAQINSVERQLAQDSHATTMAQWRQRLADSPVAYDAIGLLRASSVYDGVNLPRLFRVVDPVTDRTLAYMVTDRVEGTVDYLGEIVGVKGQYRFDPQMKRVVLVPTQIKRLESASE